MKKGMPVIKSIKITIIALIAVTSVLFVPDALRAEDQAQGQVHVATLANPSSLDLRKLDLVKGWSFFSFDTTPIAEEPEDLFKGIPIENNLYGFYPYSTSIEGRTIKYNQTNRDAFGPIDQNLGYWIKLDADTTLKYWGFDTYRTKSTWLRQGWNMIAYPYTTSQDVANLKIRSHETGNEISFAEARSLQIVDSTMYGWTNDETQGLFDVGLEEDFSSNIMLEQNHAYWIQALKEGYDIVINKPV